MAMVAEGVYTARTVHERAVQMGMDMPITAEVYRVLYEGKDPRAAVNDLMLRSPEGRGVTAMSGLRHAFKEWAVICQALAEGRQASCCARAASPRTRASFRSNIRASGSIPPTFTSSATA